VHPVLVQLGPVAVQSHPFFVGLGVLAAAVVVLLEARRRGMLGEGMLVAVTGALVGGAIGMRAAGFVRHLDPAANPSLSDAWLYGAKSILGGLTGAYLGVLIAKRLVGYQVRTGDVFAPAVALGMAIGRIGCFLAEPPGRPSAVPWAIHAPETVPQCPGCASGAAMHPSFLYEIAFHLAAFVALWALRDRVSRPGSLLTYYLAAYAVFRFGVEFVRANEVVALGLTRPQWFLVAVTPLLLARAAVLVRDGGPHPRAYAG
jgi:prolipoprotein diacylglyceryl transferase